MKICRQIVAKSDGWNWKDDPMAFRQGLLLKDMSSTPPEGKLLSILEGIYILKSTV